MRTSKPISTISYNHDFYLKARLEELYRNRKISDWIFIKHTAEEDEKKDHIHLWIKPNTLLDTMELQLFLQEYDINNPTKPLKCIDFCTSQIDDWILYSMHYAPYLASKNESREYAYTKEDFVFCDEDTFEDSFLHALKGSEWAHRNQLLEQLANRQINPSELILNGSIPLNMACQINAFNYMRDNYGMTDRGGRPNHEDPEN